MAKSKENLEIKDLEYDAEGLYIQDGSDPKITTVYSSGSLGLDVLLNGGYNDGIIQTWGPDGIGKTTLLLIMASQFQKKFNYENVRVYLHATEGRYNPRLLKMAPELKMDSPTEMTLDGKPRPIFRITYPKVGEQMYDFIERTVKQEKIHFFHIVDSCDGIKSVVNDGKNYTEGEKMANIATLNTRFCKETSVYLNHYGHIVAYTQQVRDKISQGFSHVSGVGKGRSGGNALEHYSNMRLTFEKLWTNLYIYEDPNDTKSRVIGHQMSTVLEKVSNSCNVRSKAQIPFIYDKGIDKDREILQLSFGFNLLSKKGAWIVKDGENVAQGEKKMLEILKNKPELANELETMIRQMSGIL